MRGYALTRKTERGIKTSHFGTLLYIAYLNCDIIVPEKNDVQNVESCRPQMVKVFIYEVNSFSLQVRATKYTSPSSNIKRVSPDILPGKDSIPHMDENDINLHRKSTS